MDLLFLTPALTAYLLFLTALLGLVMGSFLNCLAWRLAHGESVVRGRSHCALCGHPLSALDLAPVLSWLCLRGRCRYCGEKISPRYPAAELLTAVVYVSVVLRCGLTWAALRFLLLGSVLVALSLVDLEVGLLPDRLLLAGAVGFVVLLLPEQDRWTLLARGVAGALALFVPMLLLVLLLDKVTGRETMGGGDLKLMALLGLYFGWQVGLFLLILSCFLGLALALLMGRARPGVPFPFGPALALSAWAALLCGRDVVNWYISLF